MTSLYIGKGIFPHAYVEPTIRYILRTQDAGGAIAWFDRGRLDPWDHVEAAMALSIGGQHAAAARAYHWLRRAQRDDGSWWAGYDTETGAGEPHVETNFVAYVATGVWHHFLITGDRPLLRRLWPMVEAAIEFVIDHQAHTGEVHWAVHARGGVYRDALVTGCCSIYKSLECALCIASALDRRAPHWAAARDRLGHAILEHPERFDRTWKSKSRYAMDWFYPVLCGVLRGAAARRRLSARWHAFVEYGLGCRCVADRPWVTVAETCELTLALLGAGEQHKAAQLFSWLHDYRDADGAYWTGYAIPERRMWPPEKATWTAGAVLLAADALAGATPAARLFTRVSWPDPAQRTERVDPARLREQT